jgi:hypothetical protein
MKHSLKLLYLVPLFVLFIQSSCKKEKLPPETAIGANTFGCRVNGEIFMPSGGDASWGWYPVEGGAFQDVDGNVGLYIRTVSGNTKFIDLYIKKVTSTGIYNLNFNTAPFPIAVRAENYGYYGIKDNSGNYSDFVTSTQYTGWVNLKFKANRIYAGTFEFTAYNQKTGETVTITDGRFDVKH